MTLGFYFDNAGLPYMDLSQPYLGNPGIGGTQYCFLLLIYYLKKYKPEWEIVVYCKKSELFPEKIKYSVVNGYKDLIKKSEVDNCNFLIIKSDSNVEFLEAIKDGNQRIITWGHNFYLSSLADYIADCDKIVANVFVGKQQYERYIDHDIIKKSTYIFNMLHDPFPFVNRKINSKTVVYMGALIPSKGFHLLAKIWKDIIKIFPDAKLKVLGSGKLYSREAKLGSYGIADASYEKQFIPYISDRNGNIMQSVEFYGVVNESKYDIFKNAAVGVVNPSARTETFGMGVIEMAFCEVPIVTLNSNGYPDTVISGKTGYLEKNLNGIRNSIIKLLSDSNLNYKLGENAKKEAMRFSPEKIIPLWINLFEKLYYNKTSEIFKFKHISKPYNNNFKWLRFLNRFIRFNLRIKFIPSILNIETFIHQLIYYKK